MAKMKSGPVVGDMSGSVGCVAVSRGQKSHVMRVTGKPGRRDTAATNRSRESFTTANRAWAALSASDQAAWGVWASNYPEIDVLGQKRHLSGREAFCRLNSRLEIAGVSRITLPPSDGPKPAFEPIYLTASAALTYPFLQVTGLGDELDGQSWVWVAVKSGGGGRRWQDELKLCVRRSVAPPMHTVVFQQEYIDRWGTLLEGQKIWCVYRLLDIYTGLLSDPTMVAGVVTA